MNSCSKGTLSALPRSGAADRCTHVRLRRRDSFGKLADVVPSASVSMGLDR